MSDRNLILGAAAAADKFNTGLAATVDRNVARTRANINKMFSDVQNYRDKVDARALNIINQFPEDIEFNKVDNLHVDKLQEWATGKKQQYFESARALAQTRPGSQEFLELQSQLNNIKKSYVNVNNNLINLQAKRNEWSKNYGNISDGLNVEKKEALNKLLLPDANYQLDIDDSGSSVYTVQIDNGKNIKLTAEDLNWPEKDVEFYKQANQIGSAFASAGSQGVLIKQGDYNYNDTVGQLNMLLGTDTKNRMLSIANDDIFDGYKLNLSNEEKAQIINDPVNSKNIIVNKLLEHFQNINKNTYSQYLLNNDANDPKKTDTRSKLEIERSNTVIAARKDLKAVTIGTTLQNKKVPYTVEKKDGTREQRKGFSMKFKPKPLGSVLTDYNNIIGAEEYKIVLIDGIYYLENQDPSLSETERVDFRENINNEIMELQNGNNDFLVQKLMTDVYKEKSKDRLGTSDNIL